MKLFETPKPRNEDAAALLKALFVEMHELPVETPSKAISPSGLSCQVACAWKLTGAPVMPEKESFQSRGFAENGEDRHKRIQGFLASTEYWVDIEAYIKEKGLNLQVIEKQDYEVLLYSEEYQSRFKCDGMLKINNEYYILEIKTERQQANTYRTTPDPKHKLQGLTYSMLLDTNKIMWVYEGRDFLEQKPFVQLVLDEDKKYISDYIKQIIHFKDQPELLNKDEKACGYCSYKNYCKKYFRDLKLAGVNK